MPIPLIWPLLATLAGTEMQVAATQKSNHAQDAALNQELLRQDAYRKRAQEEFARSMAQSVPTVAKQQIGQGQETYKGAYGRAENVPLSASATASPLQRSASVVNTQREKANQERSDLARANVMGYNEWDMQRAIKNLLAQQQLAQTANFAQGSSRILPMELQHAQHEGDNLAGIGSLLGTAGAVMSLGSLFGSQAATEPLTASQQAAFDAGAGPVTPAGATSFFNQASPFNPTAANRFFTSPYKLF